MKLNVIFNSFAIIGSTILLLCLIPQLIRLYRTKSSHDISLLWLLMTMLGLGFLIMYTFYFKLYSLGIPIILQLFLYTIMLIMKIRYDHLAEKQLKSISII
jgi:uncharacterized protein with PQ loop repeat